MKKVILFLFLILLGSSARAEKLIEEGATLTLDQCVDIAIKNHPSVVAQDNALKASSSRIGEVSSAFWPQLNFDASYTRTKPLNQPVTTTFGTPTPLNPTGITTTQADKDKSYNLYAMSFNAQQLIFDFGKTMYQTKIAEYNRDASGANLNNTVSQIAFAVKQAYYAALQAKRNQEVIQESVDNAQKHLDQAKGFFEVGTRAKFDVTNAEVLLSNNKLQLIQAQNAYRIALVTLNNTMGMPEAPAYTIEDNLEYQKYEITFDDALKKAYGNRPDLIAVMDQEKAARKSVDVATVGYLPYLTANAQYQWQGSDFRLPDEWSVGAAFVWPIFNGFLTQNQINESKYNLNTAKANENLIRQVVLLDVQQSFLNLSAAEEAIPAAQLVVKQAADNLDLANGRYAAGVGNPVEITDAELAYNNSKVNENQALYNYKIAQASLQKAMGEK